MEVDRNGLEVLDRAECLRLLSQRDPRPDRVHLRRAAVRAARSTSTSRRRILVRTRRGGRLDAALRDAVVAFEVDDVDLAAHAGWSVAVTGFATEVRDPAMLDGAEVGQPSTAGRRPGPIPSSPSRPRCSPADDSRPDRDPRRRRRRQHAGDAPDCEGPRRVARRVRANPPPRRAARAAMFLRPRPRGVAADGGPDPSSATRSITCRTRRTSTRTGWQRRGGPRCSAPPGAWPAARRPGRRRRRCRPAPSNRHTGSNPSVSARLAARGHSTRSRTPLAEQPGRLEPEDRRADVLHREVEVVDGRFDAGQRRRRASTRPARAVAWSDRPVANRRWMTVSCRSRAIRSRSSTSAKLWTRACRRTFWMATPAAAARPTASSSSTSVNVVAGRLVGQVEVAEHLAADPDRHARGTTASAGGSAGTRSCRGAR